MHRIPIDIRRAPLIPFLTNLPFHDCTSRQQLVPFQKGVSGARLGYTHAQTSKGLASGMTLLKIVFYIVIVHDDIKSVIVVIVVES
jgi:hypothetical protein